MYGRGGYGILSKVLNIATTGWPASAALAGNGRNDDFKIFSHYFAAIIVGPTT